MDGPSDQPGPIFSNRVGTLHSIGRTHTAPRGATLIRLPALTFAMRSCETGGGGVARRRADGSTGPDAGSDTTGGPSRILIAEDNTINQRVAQRLIVRLGYVADVVSNGVEAVWAVAQTPYAAVLMDCQMPEMDGYDAVRAIRRWEAARPRDGEQRRLPIIAFTALSTAADRERCFAAGMDDYLSKPVQPADLERVLACWLRR
jgi:CheY-like chemotaxis protein